MTESVALGIDIGGTNTVYGFVGNSGHVHHHKEIPTHGSKSKTGLEPWVGISL